MGGGGGRRYLATFCSMAITQKRRGSGRRRRRGGGRRARLMGEIKTRSRATARNGFARRFSVERKIIFFFSRAEVGSVCSCPVKNYGLTMERQQPVVARRSSNVRLFSQYPFGIFAGCCLVAEHEARNSLVAVRVNLFSL